MLLKTHQGSQKWRERLTLKTTRSGPEDPHGPSEVAELVINIITVVGFILWFIFTYQAVKNFPYGEVMSIVTPVIVIEAAFLLYMASWLYGAKFDTKAFKKIFNQDIKMRTPPMGFVFLAGVPILFGIMAYFALSNRYRFTAITALALLVFWSYNILSNWFMHRLVMDKAFLNSCAEYRSTQDYAACFRLHEGFRYHRGTWQKVRFATGWALAAILLVLVASNFHITLAAAIPYLQPEMVISLCFLLFVIIVEGWMHLRRIKFKESMRVMRWGNKNFELLPLFDCSKCHIMSKQNPAGVDSNVL